MYRVHHFCSSEKAYEAALDGGAVREGDVLVIAAERIIGIASTDPIAITVSAGALRELAPMPRDALLGEVAHTAAEIRRAVEEGLRHHFSVAEQYLGFASSAHYASQSQVRLTLSRDEIMVTDDAIRRRVNGFRERLAIVGRETSEGLFLEQAIDRLTRAQEQLASALMPTR